MPLRMQPLSPVNPVDLEELKKLLAAGEVLEQHPQQLIRSWVEAWPEVHPQPRVAPPLRSSPQVCAPSDTAIGPSIVGLMSLTCVYLRFLYILVCRVSRVSVVCSQTPEEGAAREAAE